MLSHHANQNKCTNLLLRSKHIHLLLMCINHLLQLKCNKSLSHIKKP